MGKYIVQINFKDKMQMWREHITANNADDAYAQADKILDDWRRIDPNTRSVTLIEDKETTPND